MEMMSIGNDEYVCFDEQTELQWEKRWVHLLVGHTAGENLDQVRDLGWFSLCQILGDDVWQFLITRNEHESAQRCFDYMIENHNLPVEKLPDEFKGTNRYKVIH